MSDKTRILLDDCFLHDKDRLRHDDALDILKNRLNPIVKTSKLPLEQACGRVIAEEIKAPRNVPLHDNAAVDGFAYRASDFDDIAGKFTISGRITAGDLAPPVLEQNTASRIFTGAAMPPGADTVAMQEDCTLVDGMAVIPPGLKPGANRRLAGEDLAAGDILLEQGHKLRPQDSAAIASIGLAKIEVYDLLKVALISTGDELRHPGEDIKPGQVYDSNRYLLHALLQAANVKITDCGIIEDRASSIQNAISSAAENHDAILTTGGASRGDEDHVTAILDQLGKRHMWQMAIKPGRPLMFGQINRSDSDCLFFGLPGNPVAAMVCFLLYVKPALDVLAGGKWREPSRYPLPAMFDITAKKPDRREFLRGKLTTDDRGVLSVDKFAREGSGIISSLRESDGLIEISEDVVRIKRGEPVSFIPFSEFGI